MEMPIKHSIRVKPYTATPLMSPWYARVTRRMLSVALDELFLSGCTVTLSRRKDALISVAEGFWLRRSTCIAGHGGGGWGPVSHMSATCV
jgi:hypothetical protein